MDAKSCIKSFCKAIEEKKLDSAKTFLPEEGPVIGILHDGSILENADDFLDFFAEWFEEDHWSISHDIVFLEESSEMTYAVAECEYFDKNDDGEFFSAFLYTTITFRKVDEKWCLTHFQQTEVIEDENETPHLDS